MDGPFSPNLEPLLRAVGEIREGLLRLAYFQGAKDAALPCLLAGLLLGWLLFRK